MKTSLFTAAVLLMFVGSFSVNAGAQVADSQNESTQAPPLAPVQIIPAAVVVKPVTRSSDAESVAQLRRAEAEFKGAEFKGATEKPVAVVVPQAPKPIAAKPRVKTPATVVRVSGPQVAAKSSAKPSAKTRSVRASRMDAAGLLTARCATLGRRTLSRTVKCMNAELNRAELAVDSAEVKLMNCGQIRKFDRTLAPETIDAFVTGRLYQLRFKATQSFNKEVAKEGARGKLKMREIELRATLNHLNTVSVLAAKVCDAQAFQRIYAEAATSAR
jgi:hypothetical protein